MKLSGIVIFLMGLFAIFEITGIRQHFDVQYFRSVIDANPSRGLLIFVVLFALGNLIQLPGIIFLASAVLTLGQLRGGIVTYVGAVSSCLVTYGVIQLIGKDTLREFESPLARKIFRNLDNHPIKSITLLRIVFQTLSLLNYSLAMSRVKFKDYLIGTLIGLPVPIFLYTVFLEFLAENVFHILLT